VPSRIGKKSRNRGCWGEKGLGVLSLELGCVSGLGPRLSLLGVAYELLDILGVLSACGTSGVVGRVAISEINQILTTTDAPCSCDCRNCGRKIERAKSVEVFKCTELFLEASSKDLAHYRASTAGLQVGVFSNLPVTNG